MKSNIILFKIDIYAIVAVNKMVNVFYYSAVGENIKYLLNNNRPVPLVPLWFLLTDGW